MATAEKLLEEAIRLKPIEQAKLIDGLIAILDKPDADNDQLWAEEAESRLKAYKEGKIKSVSLEEIMSKNK